MMPAVAPEDRPARLLEAVPGLMVGAAWDGVVPSPGGTNVVDDKREVVVVF